MTAYAPESFTNDSSLLAEDYRVADLFNNDLAYQDFKQKVINSPHKSIIGLIGEYGTGKSTLLHNVSQNIEKDLWIEFDAWKFPERKELWEGFVLDFARQIDQGSFEKTRNKIDGKQNDDKQTLINTVGSIPGLAAIKSLTHFYETSPARRTYEIQEILKGLIEEKAKKKTIFIVVEDIDRSGDAGIFFLETLKYFLQNLETETTIRVVVPIAETKFYEHSDSYIKCLDVVDFHKATSMNMDRFVSKIFKDSLFTDQRIKNQLARFLEHLMLESDMSIRKLKLILRKADLNYKNQQLDGLEPEFRTSILFEAAKYLKEPDKPSAFDNFKKNKRIAHPLLSAFAYSIASEQNLVDHEGKLQRPTQQFNLISRTTDPIQHPSPPYLIRQRFGDEHYSYCCDFYLNY